MPVVANSYWTFEAADGNHIVTASVTTRAFARPVLEFNVDVKEGEDYKQSIQLDANLVSDHPIRVGDQIGILKIVKKNWWGSVALELHINGELVPNGQHVVLARSASSPSPPQSTAADVKSDSQTMYPVLPSTCETCGAPVSMDAVKWTGPMHAACASCGGAVAAEWRKVAE